MVFDYGGLNFFGTHSVKGLQNAYINSCEGQFKTMTLCVNMVETRDTSVVHLKNHKEKSTFLLGEM